MGQTEDKHCSFGIYCGATKSTKIHPEQKISTKFCPCSHHHQTFAHRQGARQAHFSQAITQLCKLANGVATSFNSASDCSLQFAGKLFCNCYLNEINLQFFFIHNVHEEFIVGLPNSPRTKNINEYQRNSAHAHIYIKPLLLGRGHNKHTFHNLSLMRLSARVSGVAGLLAEYPLLGKKVQKAGGKQEASVRPERIAASIMSMWHISYKYRKEGQADITHCWHFCIFFWQCRCLEEETTTSHTHTQAS